MLSTDFCRTRYRSSSGSQSMQTAFASATLRACSPHLLQRPSAKFQPSSSSSSRQSFLQNSASRHEWQTNGAAPHRLGRIYEPTRASKTLAGRVISATLLRKALQVSACKYWYVTSEYQASYHLDETKVRRRSGGIRSFTSLLSQHRCIATDAGTYSE